MGWAVWDVTARASVMRPGVAQPPAVRSRAPANIYTSSQTGVKQGQRTGCASLQEGPQRQWTGSRFRALSAHATQQVGTAVRLGYQVDSQEG
jgi:hypothetical protein